jgi:hypothetical protein
VIVLLYTEEPILLLIILDLAIDKIMAIIIGIMIGLMMSINPLIHLLRASMVEKDGGITTKIIDHRGIVLLGLVEMGKIGGGIEIVEDRTLRREGKSLIIWRMGCCLLIIG